MLLFCFTLYSFLVYIFVNTSICFLIFFCLCKLQKENKGGDNHSNSGEEEGGGGVHACVS